MRFFANLSIRKKLILSYAVTAILILIANIFVYVSIYRTVSQVDDVFVGNISLTELAGSLDAVQKNMTGYLQTKTTDDMDAYYKAYQDYYDQVQELPDEVTTTGSTRMSRNIRVMSDTYLAVTEAAIEAKRGRNIEKYRQQYVMAEELYGYLNVYINSLNNELLSANSADYLVLTRSFNYVAIMNALVIVWLTILNVLIVTFVVNRITKPLSTLVDAAEQVAKGDYDVVIPDTKARDETGILITTFDRMLDSIRHGVVTEAKLHEAQLKFLQAQINPHFLFNTLNAGAQLAMMEDADRTYEYIQNVADFFRYNIKKQDLPVPLSDEIEMVDTYIYIINIRFAGEIGYKKEIDDELCDVMLPAMTLQPIVENAVSHGIRDITYPGYIELRVTREGDVCRIDVYDNGVGMTAEQVEAVSNGRPTSDDAGETGRDHNGVGLNNVVSRLRLQYPDMDIFEISSEGKNKGTTVTLRLPVEAGASDTKEATSGEADTAEEADV